MNKTIGFQVLELIPELHLVKRTKEESFSIYL